MLQECFLCGLYVPSSCHWAFISVDTFMNESDSQADWLWELVPPTLHKLFCGIHSCRLVCLLRSPFGRVVYGANQVVNTSHYKPWRPVGIGMLYIIFSFKSQVKKKFISNFLIKLLFFLKFDLNTLIAWLSLTLFFK